MGTAAVKMPLWMCFALSKKTRSLLFMLIIYVHARNWHYRRRLGEMMWNSCCFGRGRELLWRTKPWSHFHHNCNVYGPRKVRVLLREAWQTE